MSKQIKQTTHKHSRGNGGKEVRSFSTGSNLQVWDNKGSKRLTGYAIRFGQPSTDMGFIEYVDPGAVKLLRDKDILLLRDHSQSLLLGRTTAGNLKLTVDRQGLRFDCTLLDTETANTAHTDIKAGLLTGCSWGFIVLQDKWEQVDSKMVRTILDMEIFEISVTSFPAYQSSSVDARSLEEIKRSVFSTDALADDNADDNLDEDNGEDRCSCDCAECEAGDCDECSDPDCTDEWCKGCPNQGDDDLRSLRMKLTAAQKRARLSDLEIKADKDRAWIVRRLKELDSKAKK